MKNILIAVGSVVGFALLVGFCAWQMVPPDAPPVSASQRDAAERIVVDTQRIGLVARVDDGTGYCYVDPARWARLTVEEKQGIARAFAIYFKARGGTGYAHIYDNFTGKRIASLTSFGSFSVE